MKKWGIHKEKGSLLLFSYIIKNRGTKEKEKKPWNYGISTMKINKEQAVQ